MSPPVRPKGESLSAQHEGTPVTLQVVFRTDASLPLGAGHVTRCLVLAARLQARGVRCFFLCRPAAGDAIGAIEAAGHTVLSLPAGLPDAATDAKQSLAALAAAGLPSGLAWVIADHYALGAGWQHTLRQATGARVMVIDGQANRSHDADLLLDPVGLPGSERRWDGLLPAGCQRLIGPGHALLRPEFRAPAALPAARDDDALRILLSFGGSDAPNATGRVLEALCGQHPLYAAVDVVIGAGYPHGAALAEFAASRPAITVHRQPAHLAALMRRAHLAVCAGGGTLLELCALQVPALVVTIAENQRGPAEALAQAGCAVHLGPLEALNPAAAYRQTAALLSDRSRRRAMREAQAVLMVKPAHDVVDCLVQAQAGADASALPTRLPLVEVTAASEP